MTATALPTTEAQVPPPSKPNGEGHARPSIVRAAAAAAAAAAALAVDRDARERLRQVEVIGEQIKAQKAKVSAQKHKVIVQEAKVAEEEEKLKSYRGELRKQESDLADLREQLDLLALGKFSELLPLAPEVRKPPPEQQAPDPTPAGTNEHDRPNGSGVYARHERVDLPLAKSLKAEAAVLIAHCKDGFRWSTDADVNFRGWQSYPSETQEPVPTRGEALRKGMTSIRDTAAAKLDRKDSTKTEAKGWAAVVKAAKKALADLDADGQPQPAKVVSLPVLGADAMVEDEHRDAHDPRASEGADGVEAFVAEVNPGDIVPASELDLTAEDLEGAMVGMEIHPRDPFVSDEVSYAHRSKIGKPLRIGRHLYAVVTASVQTDRLVYTLRTLYAKGPGAEFQDWGKRRAEKRYKNVAPEEVPLAGVLCQEADGQSQYLFGPDAEVLLVEVPRRQRRHQADAKGEAFDDDAILEETMEDVTVSAGRYVIRVARRQGGRWARLAWAAAGKHEMRVPAEEFAGHHATRADAITAAADAIHAWIFEVLDNRKVKLTPKARGHRLEIVRALDALSRKLESEAMVRQAGAEVASV